jgi:hypothetical protein
VIVSTATKTAKGSAQVTSTEEHVGTGVNDKIPPGGNGQAKPPRPTPLHVRAKRIPRELKLLLNRCRSSGGYAGTGKTTVLCALAEELPDFAVAAFTGKARRC